VSTQPLPAYRPPVATLECEGRPFPLFPGENHIGRSRDCGIVLSDTTVSRRHAVITIDGDAIWIHDLDSKNGTYVEGERISRRQVTCSEIIGFGAVIARMADPESSAS